MRWLRRVLRAQGGQTSGEYLGVLAVVSVLVAALVVANPGIGQSLADGMRQAICTIAGAGCEVGVDVASGDGGGGGGGEQDDGGSWLDRLGPVGDVLGQVGQFAEGFGSQIWDEVKGLGETAAWVWRTITSAEQRRENGEVWDAIVDDPLGAAEAVLSGIWEPIQTELDNGRPAAAVGRGAASVLSIVFGGKGLTKLRRLRPDVDDVGRRRPDADADDVARRRPDCLVNSFVGMTPVLLADGSLLPIAEVAVGDLVLAADPGTGAVGARVVTDLIVGGGPKTLVDVTVAGGTVTATDGHPFYAGGWVDAADLEAGDRLRSADGDDVTVQAVRQRRATATVHNLTVAGLHTYHVAVGGEAVLVHNASTGCIDESAKVFSPEERRIAELLSDEGRTVQAVPESTVRTPDALVDGVPWEFKSLGPGATNATVRNRLNDAKGQARNALVDARGSGLTEAEARRGIARFVGANPGRMDAIRIVGDGFEVTWP